MSAACGWCRSHKFQPCLPARGRVPLWAKGATSLQNEFYKKVALALMDQALAAIKIKAFRDDLCGPASPGPASPSPPVRAGECAAQGRVLSHPASAAADERWWPHPQSVVRPGPLCAAGVCGLCGHEGRRGGAEPLPGPGAEAAWDCPTTSVRWWPPCCSPPHAG